MCSPAVWGPSLEMLQGAGMGVSPLTSVSPLLRDQMAGLAQQRHQQQLQQVHLPQQAEAVQVRQQGNPQQQMRDTPVTQAQPIQSLQQVLLQASAIGRPRHGSTSASNVYVDEQQQQHSRILPLSHQQQQHQDQSQWPQQLQEQEQHRLSPSMNQQQQQDQLQQQQQQQECNSPLNQQQQEQLGFVQKGQLPMPTSMELSTSGPALPSELIHQNQQVEDVTLPAELMSWRGIQNHLRLQQQQYAQEFVHHQEQQARTTNGRMVRVRNVSENAAAAASQPASNPNANHHPHHPQHQQQQVQSLISEHNEPSSFSFLCLPNTSDGVPEPVGTVLGAAPMMAVEMAIPFYGAMTSEGTGYMATQTALSVAGGQLQMPQQQVPVEQGSIAMEPLGRRSPGSGAAAAAGPATAVAGGVVDARAVGEGAAEGEGVQEDWRGPPVLHTLGSLEPGVGEGREAGRGVDAAVKVGAGVRVGAARALSFKPWMGIGSGSGVVVAGAAGFPRTAAPGAFAGFVVPACAVTHPAAAAAADTCGAMAAADRAAAAAARALRSPSAGGMYQAVEAAQAAAMAAAAASGDVYRTITEPAGRGAAAMDAGTSAAAAAAGGGAVEVAVAEPGGPAVAGASGGAGGTGSDTLTAEEISQLYWVQLAALRDEYMGVVLEVKQYYEQRGEAAVLAKVLKVRKGDSSPGGAACTVTKKSYWLEYVFPLPSGWNELKWT